MMDGLDPALVAFVGSETRVRTLGVLANAEFPMTGYRVAKVARVQEIKVYQELKRAVEAKIVRKEKDGFRLVDPDFRLILRKRYRVSWSGDWNAGEPARAARAERAKQRDRSWLRGLNLTPDPKVAARYGNFGRPPEKGPSRKTGWR